MKIRVYRFRRWAGAGGIFGIAIGTVFIAPAAFSESVNLPVPFAGGAQQPLVDSYWVGGVQAPLTIHPDSFSVSTTGPIDSVTAAALVGEALSGVSGGRALGSTAWILGVDPVARDRLRDAVLQLRADPEVRWAGFLVRAPNAPYPAVIADEFIVQFSTQADRVEIDRINEENGVEVVREPRIWPNHFLLRVTEASELDALAMANQYFGDPLVEYAHPNFFLMESEAADPSFSDPEFHQQWHLYNPVLKPNGERADIHVQEAWNTTKGDPDVVIAVIEPRGYQLDHLDLAGNLWENPWYDSTGGPWPGKNAGLNGWNFEGCPGTYDPPDAYRLDSCGDEVLFEAEPQFGHGTQVAGVAAAVAENGEGGKGVCPECRLMLIRLGVTNSDYRHLAFFYASEMGADVINFSYLAFYDDDTFKNAIEQVADNSRGPLGTTIVVAAQNGIRCVHYPQSQRYIQHQQLDPSQVVDLEQGDHRLENQPSRRKGGLALGGLHRPRCSWT